MKNILEIFKDKREEREDYWISISDLMAGLMMIFMFIAVAFMIHISNEKNKMKDIAATYETLKVNLYTDLSKEFEDDLEKWNAEIDRKNLSVRFKEPDVFFDPGSANLKDKFQEILYNFFPRYIKILTKPEYINEIEEVRIEGHTSSRPLKVSYIRKNKLYKKLPPYKISYFDNMLLSQARARGVLYFVMTLKEIHKYENWLMKHLTANGLSYSQRIIINGKEDFNKSRRVEFRVRTKAENRIEKILKNNGAVKQ